jgi:hypothetical protein
MILCHSYLLFVFRVFLPRFKYDTEPTRLDRRAECTCRSDTMTNCYNCGHTGTFVLLVQFPLTIPGSDDPEDSDVFDATRTRSDGEVCPDSGGVSVAVQCPACDSTDVGLGAEDLLARYLSSTTS